MKCSYCGTEVPSAKKTCPNCGKAMSGFVVNNVTGEYGYRDENGMFHPYFLVMKKKEFVLKKNAQEDYSDIGIFHSKGLSRFEIDAYAVLSGTFLRRNDSTFCFMWIHEDTRLANDEEKQRLFDALEKDGYRWNAKEKKIEKIPRWRAKEGETYYCLSATLHVLEAVESLSTIDDVFHSLGNYFKTKEAAQNVSQRILEIFKDSKAL